MVRTAISGSSLGNASVADARVVCVTDGSKSPQARRRRLNVPARAGRCTVTASVSVVCVARICTLSVACAASMGRRTPGQRPDVALAKGREIGGSSRWLMA